MFDRDLFEYDPSTHIGKYEGEAVPSVTQLLDIFYPYSEDIPQERLTKAAEHGTKVHNAIETLNVGFDNALSFKEDLRRVISLAKEIKITRKLNEVIDYVSVLSAYKLRPYDYEELIFLLDENEDLICFGHYDCTMLAKQDIAFFQEDRLYLTDFKTTSLFDKKKVKLQLNMYALAYEQMSKNQIDNVFGFWFDENPKLIPLGRYDNDYVIKVAIILRQQWNARQRRIENGEL